MDTKWPAVSRIPKFGFTNIMEFIKSTIFFLFISARFSPVSGKGGAMTGGKSNLHLGGAGVCLDCGNYTPEEMQVALVILIVILCVFFALCSCQCYNRMKYECNEDMYNKPHTVPVAPYYRDTNNMTSMNQSTNLTAALMGANSASEIILPFSSNYNNV